MDGELESRGSAGETEDEGEHTGVSEVQQCIFLPFYHLLVMTATTGAYKSMRNPAGFTGCTQPNTMNPNAACVCAQLCICDYARVCMPFCVACTPGLLPHLQKAVVDQ